MPTRATFPLSSLVLLGLLLLSPASRAEADTGTFSITGGAMALERRGGPDWHPAARTDLSFRLAGPLQFGAYLEASAAEPVFDGPAFGGGVLVTLRPRLPVLGLVPSVEVSGGRMQLPGDQRERIRAWTANVGVGLGFEIANGFMLEGRARHSWLFDVEASGFGERAWTVTGGVAVAIP